MKERLQRLLCVKSMVTLILAITFSALTARGVISGEQFATVFTTVISFYFGTQHERIAEQKELTRSKSTTT